jgi:hypothetical protein
MKSIACMRVMIILWDAERVDVLRYWIPHGQSFIRVVENHSTDYERVFFYSAKVTWRFAWVLILNGEHK